MTWDVLLNRSFFLRFLFGWGLGHENIKNVGVSFKDAFGFGWASDFLGGTMTRALVAPHPQVMSHPEDSRSKPSLWKIASS